MKRGNTALKRGVGLASAFALAIAGAVLAAPAANAAAGTGPAATDALRVAPVANAANVDSTGAAADYTFGRGYGSAGTDAATGTAKVLKAGTNGQQVGGLQIALPYNFAAGPITVTLTGADFTGVPSVTLDPVERKAADLTGLAGFTGDNASVAGAISGKDLADGTLGASTLTGSDELTINLAKPATVGADTSGVYLLSLNNVAVNVASATAAGTAVTAALKLGATAAGVTTVGYVGATSLAIASGAAEADGGALTLPDVTLTEAQVAAITGATVINLTSDAAGAKFAAATSDTKVTVSGSAATVAFTATIADGDTSFSITPGSPDAAKIETYTISGLKVKDVPANATVTLTVNGSAITQVNNPGATTTAGSTSQFAFTPGLSGVSASIATTVPEPRIAGSDRYATAAAILDEGIDSGAFTPGHTGPGAVVLANGETAKQGVDALSANYLAGAKQVPILLTAATSLPVATQTALIKLFKDTTTYTGDITVYVLGKTDSVSQAVRDQAKALIKSVVTLPAGKDVVIKEVAGDNRYSTSAAVATEAGAAALQVHSLDTAKGWLRTAFLTSGLSNADALAAGSVAAKAGIPVFLTNGTVLDEKVQAAIKDLGIQQVIVLGGADRVSDALVTSLADLGVTNTKRIAEKNRYETAAAIYSWAWAAVNPTESGVTSRGLGWGGSDSFTAYIANGTDGFADALAVGPLAGDGSNPILTTAVDSLGDGATKFLKTNKADFKTNGIEALGQQDRISSAVITAAQAALK